eukprot:CAMPEP_0204917324 /NCGR_PEP_ID=MMETSP1397-20131031/14919_1 /ASSEMBLY_ACC=CAM_ASM_000891 /TAXON_ID=49980 /ORGANISM="Climacostomum Climacostomum virens, Strain Stock W-24" /LENGTH=607 /DNA_ID=CAMNT_0052090117 /DNA_START=269 /DNA_END=2092 /DNA_ORIENTATION=-
MSNSSLKESESTKVSSFDLSKSFVFQKRSLPKTPTLDNLRKRNSHHDVEMTPDLAVRVMREFIMPMFKLDRKQQEAKRRLITIGLGSPENFTGGIFGELKLSDTLHLELQEAKAQIDSLTKQLKTMQQHKEQANNDVSILQDLNARLHAQIGMLRLQYNDLLVENQRLVLCAQGKDEQSEDFKKQIAQFDSKNMELVSEMQQERDKNDKLYGLNVELQQNNNLLRIENDVMAERVKGLYEALSFLPLHYHVEKYLELQVTKRKQWEIEMWEQIEDLKAKNSKLYQENDDFKGSLDLMLRIKNELRDERDKLFNKMRSKLIMQDKEYQVATQERDTARRDLEHMSKQYESLTQEHSRLRTKVKHYRLTRRETRMEEKLCKSCHKVYFESDNFNWSCSTHSSEFSGELWWCCGRVNKDAPGCRKAKHVSKDEDEEDEEKTNKVFLAKFCTSCKSHGHLSNGCPKDPNPRSVENIGMEVERIKNIKRMKKHTSEVLDQSAIINQIMTRLGDLHPFCNPDQSSSHDSERFESDMNHSFFSDVQEAKLSCTFDQSSNLFNTEQYLATAKELDLKSSKRDQTKLSMVRLRKRTESVSSSVTSFKSLQKKLSRV